MGRERLWNEPFILELEKDRHEFRRLTFGVVHLHRNEIFLPSPPLCLYLVLRAHGSGVILGAE